MEVEVRGSAGMEVQALVPVGGAGNHEASFSRRQVADAGEHTMRRVLDGDLEPIALVHKQGLSVGRKGRSGRAGGACRAGGNAIHLDEGKVRRFQTIAIAECEVEAAFDAVDMQRGAPVCFITTDLRDEWRETGWIELHLQEGRTGCVGYFRS